MYPQQASLIASEYYFQRGKCGRLCRLSHAACTATAISVELVDTGECIQMGQRTRGWLVVLCSGLTDSRNGDRERGE